MCMSEYERSERLRAMFDKLRETDKAGYIFYFLNEISKNLDCVREVIIDSKVPAKRKDRLDILDTMADVYRSLRILNEACHCFYEGDD